MFNHVVLKFILYQLNVKRKWETINIIFSKCDRCSGTGRLNTTAGEQGQPFFQLPRPLPLIYYFCQLHNAVYSVEWARLIKGWRSIFRAKSLRHTPDKQSRIYSRGRCTITKLRGYNTSKCTSIFQMLANVRRKVHRDFGIRLAD